MMKYLAGIFDAEGYVRIRRTTSGKKLCYTPEVRLYMCDKQIVQEFANLYNLEVKQGDRGQHRKLAYYVGIGTKLLKSTTFIKDFLPLLNEKRLQLKQVDLILNSDKDKEQCYQDYMKCKLTFDHPINGELSYEYLAGIIDGDGWFSMFNAGKGFSAHNKYSVGLQQRYLPMIEYMTKFGGSNANKCKVYDYQSHVQTYAWQCTINQILPFLKNIEPHLIEKKVKCQSLIEYIEKFEEFRLYSEKTLNKWNQEQF